MTKKNTMNTELEVKKLLAIKFGLLPKGIYEFEFTVTVPDWQAESLEYWKSKERKECEHVTVEIPEKYRNQFVFVAAKHQMESIQRSDGIEQIKW